MKRLIYLLFLLPFIGFGQVSTGQEQQFDYGIQNLAPQTVTNPNYIVTEGTDHTYGRMNTTNLISPDRLSLTNMGRSTGLYSFASGGIVAASGTTFNVGAVNGFIVSSASPSTTAPLPVAYPGGTGLTTPFLLTAPATYVLAKSDNTLLLQSTAPTVTEKRNNIYLGVIGHPAGTITGIGNGPDVCMNEMSQTRAMFEPTRLINEGVVPYANSTNLTLANTAGKLYGFGIGFIANGNDAPSILNVAAGAPMTTQYRTQGTVTFPNTTVADPLNYDVAGVQTAIPGSSNQATNQRFYLLQNGMIRIQYGQTIYATLTDAIAAVNSESFVVNVNATKLGILIGILSIQKGATNLANTTMARFLPVSKFGETVGAAAGIAIGTMQTSYNNSIVPNILTNSTLGGLSLQRGSAADTDAILIGKNGAGTNTATINGNGVVTSSALTLSTAPTTSAGTYDILTRNTSTGVTEKVPSSTFINGTGTSGQVSFWNGVNSQTGSSDLTFNGKSFIVGSSSTTSTGLGTELQIGNSLKNQITFNVGGITSGYIYNDTNETSLGSSLTGVINLQTAGTNRVSILNNGNVLIGTTTDNGNKLRVVGGSTELDQLKYTRSIDISGTDLDSLKTAGFYTGATMSNSPISGDWYYVTVERYVNDNGFVHQTATAMGTDPLVITPGRIFSRVFYGGTTWSTWIELAKTDSPALTGTPTAPTAPTSDISFKIATTSFVKSAIFDDYNFGAAVLDFPSTSPQSSSSLTISVPGAAPGDVVSLGVPPHGAADVNTCFTAKCTTADEVEVRFNNYGTLTENPTSGLFKVRAWK